MVSSKKLKHNENRLNITENLKVLQWNFLQMIWKRVECVFVMISTGIKIFSQKLEGQNFKVPYNLRRDCFQQNVISMAAVKARKLKIFVLYIYVISHLQKIGLSLIPIMGQQMHLTVHIIIYYRLFLFCNSTNNRVLWCNISQCLLVRELLIIVFYL